MLSAFVPFHGNMEMEWLGLGGTDVTLLCEEDWRKTR